MSLLTGVHRALAASLFLFAAVAVAHATEPTPTGVWSRLEAQQTIVSISEPATVLYTLRNDSPQDVWVVYWQTPLRGVFGDLFDVRFDGQTVEYIGPEYDWATPQESDFIRIPPGVELSASVDLSAAYDLRRSGEYLVRYRVPPLVNLLSKGANAAAIHDRLGSNSVTLWIDRDATTGGVSAIPGLEGDEATLTQPSVTPGFVGCSSARQSQLKMALEAAKSISNRAQDFLTAGTPDAGFADKDYRTWFGCYDIERYAGVKTIYFSVFDVLASQTVTFHCDCTRSAFAYVLPGYPYHVHLCNAFWTAPLVGIDSRAGTLVHETSHFSFVGNTKDFAYGQRFCQALAKRSPATAIQNADSYRYFAESLHHSPGTGGVAPTITGAIEPTLIGNLTPGTLVLSFTNEDCDPIVRIENRTVSSPGNWVMHDTENPGLLTGTWSRGTLGITLFCKVVSDRDLGPHVMEHVLVDAGGRRSQPFQTRVYCTYP